MQHRHFNIRQEAGRKRPHLQATVCISNVFEDVNSSAQTSDQSFLGEILLNIIYSSSSKFKAFASLASFREFSRDFASFRAYVNFAIFRGIL